MSYQVLARKWRPQRFADVVGQQHVLRPIINALENDRLHHAYLLTGTRGVGKTTIARILAKSLNCEQGVTAEPCGTCSSCTEIDQGRFVDLLEIDAASRTKVEDTRELLDNVQYRPTRGRYKVYLIDEVHMLSRHSFNALLKTLEEPPEHVKFLLATTDPQKLPVTVLSRCLQFHLKALSQQEIQHHLAHVLKAEDISFDENALLPLAKAAQGSMRDALSLTDQAIAQGQQQVTMTGIQAMLGSLPSMDVHRLLHAITVGDGEQVIQLLDHCASQLPDLSSVLSELQHKLHQYALVQVVPSAAESLRLDEEDVRLAKQIPAELVQVFYDIVVSGRRDLAYAADVRSGVEMTLLRLLAFRPEYLNVEELPIEAVQQQQTNTTSRTSETSSVNSLPVATASSDVSQGDEQELEQYLDANAATDDDIDAEHELQQQYDAIMTSVSESVNQPLNNDSAALEKSSVESTEEPEAKAESSTDWTSSIALRQQLMEKKKPLTNTPTQETNETAIDSPKSAVSSAPKAPVLESDFQDANTNPVAIPKGIKYAAEMDDWAALVENLELSGLARQAALNAQLQQVSEGRFELWVDHDFEHLLKFGAGEQLAQALSHYIKDAQVDFVSRTDTHATPAKLQSNIEAHRREEALEMLQGDADIKALRERFDAQLIESSLQLK